MCPGDFTSAEYTIHNFTLDYICSESILRLVYITFSETAERELGTIYPNAFVPKVASAIIEIKIYGHKM